MAWRFEPRNLLLFLEPVINLRKPAVRLVASELQPRGARHVDQAVFPLGAPGPGAAEKL